MDEPGGRQWFLYVLRCGDGTLYAGITVDMDRRLRAHAAGRGARYTRGRGPLELARAWACEDEGAARRAEARFKRLSRGAKLAALDESAPPPSTPRQASPQSSRAHPALDVR